jgi:predicted ABC-type ATPase
LSSTKQNNKRLRVFAGPNGSGKSTIIEAIREYNVKGKRIDFGIYINADDIAKILVKEPLDLGQFEIVTRNKDFVTTVLASGLVNDKFTEVEFKSAYTLRSNVFRLKNKKYLDQIAQILADFLRKSIIKAGKKLSFETVFSHESKLNFIRDAKNIGYKVYLYFIATETVEINIFRIKERVKNSGHNVPENKVRSRYINSLDLMYEAAQLCDQVYFFDNSDDEPNNSAFASFKLVSEKKQWTYNSPKDFPNWFFEYYIGKIQSKKRKS